VAGEVATLAADATPYVTAAMGAYGTAVLAKVRDDAADATVGVGRRLLQRVFGLQAEDEPLPGPLAGHRPDVIVAPFDDLPSGRHDPAGMPGPGPDPYWRADVRAA
jgi:hypothetical protein